MTEDLRPNRKRKFKAVLPIALCLACLSLFWYARSQKLAILEANRKPSRLLHPFRLPIKLTTDSESSKIQREPRDITLAQLIALPHSARIDTPRLSPLENHVWRLEVDVNRVEFEPDGDVVIEISDGETESATEIPEPSLTKGSPFHDDIVRVRNVAEAVIGKEFRVVGIKRRAIITGIGFAGMENSQTLSGVRLYPLLSIEWMKSSGSAR